MKLLLPVTLVITFLLTSYSAKKKELHLQLGPDNMKNAVVSLRFPTRNVEEGGFDEILAIAWTNKGFKDVM